MSGVRYPLGTRYRNVSWFAMVLAADPEFIRDANYVPEYDDMGDGRTFRGWYKSRGAYDGTYGE